MYDSSHGGKEEKVQRKEVRERFLSAEEIKEQNGGNVLYVFRGHEME